MSKSRGRRSSRDSSPPSSPGSSSRLNPLSLGRHNKTSRRQNRQSLTTSWLATQEDQSSSSDAAAAVAVQPEFLAPAITLTQPRESSEEAQVSEVLVPAQGEERSHRGVVRKPHSALTPANFPLKDESRKYGGWHGQLSATVIIDEPILEEEEEEKEREVESADQLPPPSGSQPSSLESRWNRARALSYPCITPPTSRVMLQLPRSDPAVDRGRQEGQEEEEEEEEGEGERVVESGSEAKARASIGQQPMHKFVQMAVMAKKWKNRSKHEGSTQSSRDMLCSRQKRRPLVEIPRCLKLEILDEAHHIVHKTLQMYRSELGLRHKLTLQAEQHCENLALQLNKPTN